MTSAKIATKPKGFSSITAMIAVADLQAAIEFYAFALGADVQETLTIPDTETLLHAQLRIDGTTLVLTLSETASAFAGTGHVTMHHYVDDVQAVFDRLTEAGALVVSPVAESWWGERSAVVIDPFGIRWSVAQRVEQLNAEQRKARLIEIYSTANTEEDSAPAADQDQVDAPEAEAQASAA